jgi:hypothetical protein
MSRKAKNKVRKLPDVAKTDKRINWTCEYCGIYKAKTPKCNKCQKEI